MAARQRRPSGVARGVVRGQYRSTSRVGVGRRVSGMPPPEQCRVRHKGPHVTYRRGMPGQRPSSICRMRGLSLSCTRATGRRCAGLLAREQSKGNDARMSPPLRCGAVPIGACADGSGGGQRRGETAAALKLSGDPVAAAMPPCAYPSSQSPILSPVWLCDGLAGFFSARPVRLAASDRLVTDPPVIFSRGPESGLWPQSSRGA